MTSKLGLLIYFNTEKKKKKKKILIIWKNKYFKNNYIITDEI